MPHTASQTLCLPTDRTHTTTNRRWQPHCVVFPPAQFPTVLSRWEPSALTAQLRETAETLPRTPILPFPLPLRGTMLLSRVHWQGSQRGTFWWPPTPIKDSNTTLKSLAMADQAQASDTCVSRVTEACKVTAQPLSSSVGFVVAALECLFSHKDQIQKTTIRQPNSKPFEVIRNLILGCCCFWFKRESSRG